MMYQSAPAEWHADAYSCARFQLDTPQHFQYQWRRASPTRGVVRAVADLDGDGEPELTVEQEVVCQNGPGCALGRHTEQPAPN